MTLSELAETAPPYYSFQRAEVVQRLPADEVIVAVGGYRWKVRFKDGVLYTVFPNAKSAGRGHIAIDPWATSSDRSCREILGRRYDWDSYGSQRLQEALALVISAWTIADGDIDAFYKALGQSGHCAICGATLTDPLSMSRGIGPECIKKIWVGRRGIKAVQQLRIEEEAYG